MGIDVKTHGDDLFSAAAYDASPVRARSEAQERASVLIAGRTLSVGNVLASENAPFYVAILSALADFRAGHEFEPLFEDVRDAVLGESPSQRQIDEFNADLKQLEDWKLVERRIEKMRVRGYRDNRRRKFRFRICDETRRRSSNGCAPVARRSSVRVPSPRTTFSARSSQRSARCSAR